MCGIVGYVGKREAAPILLRGLEQVEYRGYDSAGIAVLNGRLQRVRRVGRLGTLKEALVSSPVAGAVGIAHTRWATHGRVTKENAHPHTDCDGKLSVVHNGVIENAAELRAELKNKGHRFESETDSEVLAHLIEDAYDGELQAAVASVTKRVDGALAIVVASEYDPDRLIAYRRRSPLMVGEGDGEVFVGSDVSTLGEGCREVYALEEGEMAVLCVDSVELITTHGAAGTKAVTGTTEARPRYRFHGPEVAHAGLDPELVPELDPEQPIMIQEIHQQPQALRRLLTSWGDGERGQILPPVDVAASLPRLEKGTRRIWLVGCGTAYHAGRAAAWAFRKWNSAEVRTEIASEFRYFTPDLGRGDLCIAISQSGETADTLEAMYEAKHRGATTLAVVNQPASTAARDADVALLIEAGREVAVASTKAYVNQVALLSLLAVHWGVKNGEITRRDEEAFARAAWRLPEQVEALLSAQEEEMRRLARLWGGRHDVLFIGRGIDYDVAMEGQLKLKEVSYVHAESVPAGELKHGTLALVSPDFPVVALATDGRVRKKTEGSISEVRARGAEVLAITMGREGEGRTDEVDTSRGEHRQSEGGTLPRAWEHAVELPLTLPELTPILSVISLQLLAHYSGMVRNLEVDRPRNLAKSVTVE